MNKLLLCLLFITGSLSASSQRVYFVYLQSEQEEPFFVRMNETVFSSTASGYTILSRLKDSTYQFSIGFPQNKWPEQRFTINIKSKDHGFILKNFGEKGWGLFDLQTLSVLMASNESKETIKMEKKQVTAFTDILARAADDPSLRERPVFAARIEEKPAIVESKPALNTEIAKKDETKPAPTDVAIVKQNNPKDEPPSPDPIAAEVKTQPAVKIGETGTGAKETSKTSKEEQKDPPKETVNVKPVEVITQPGVKIGESGTTIKESAKTEQQESKAKTAEPVTTKPIEVITQPGIKIGEIGTEKKETVATRKEDSPPSAKVEYKPSVVTRQSQENNTEGLGVTYIDLNQDGTRDTIRITIPQPAVAKVISKEPGKDERKFLDIDSDLPSVATKTVQDTAEKKPVAVEPAKKSIVKNNCKELANDNDFLKLRKKMVGENDDDDMVDEARKYFKTKCFTTTQIKNLGVLFLDDLGKYKFFDMAYLFVADLENFSSLQSEIKSEYYLNRFKAILK